MRKARQRLAVPAARAFDATERIQLVLLVRNAEPGFESRVRRELTKEIGAECVDGSALNFLGAFAEPALEAERNLACSFVGERERADTGRVEAALFDEIANPFGQAERFAGARPCEDHD